MNEYTIKIFWQEADKDEPGCWIAENFDIPVVTESDSIDALILRVALTAPDVLSANGKNPDAKLRFLIEPLPVIPQKNIEAKTLAELLVKVA